MTVHATRCKCLLASSLSCRQNLNGTPYDLPPPKPGLLEASASTLVRILKADPTRPSRALVNALHRLTAGDAGGASACDLLLDAPADLLGTLQKAVPTLGSAWKGLGPALRPSGSLIPPQEHVENAEALLQRLVARREERREEGRRGRAEQLESSSLAGAASGSRSCNNSGSGSNSGSSSQVGSAPTPASGTSAVSTQMQQLSLRQIKRGACAACGKTEVVDGVRLHLCRGCRTTRYCSMECAHSAWRGGHRKVCKAAQAARESATAAVQHRHGMVAGQS